MNQNDTIIALATPSGSGAIAVIRISGDNAIDIVAPFFTSVSGKNLKKQPTHTVHLGHIVSEDTIIDEVLLSIFKNPNSYTGEDVIEISCHGSPYIQKEIIHLFLQQGCRMANNGEFTMRAFINGKMDLSQAEAVADLIASDSEASHQIAIQQMRGGITNELKSLRQQLLDFASLIELELDFSGEDVEFADRSQFNELLMRIANVLKRLIESFAYGNAMKNGIPVAIIGEPNVGKSTLLNALLKEEKAIVSDIAGTTRDAIEDEVIIEGVVFRFIDTAGIRETKDAIENIGIKKAFEKANKAQLVIYLLDAKRLLEHPEDSQKEIRGIREQLEDKRLLVLANKIDALSETEIADLNDRFPAALPLSAKKTIGIDDLKSELIALVNKGTLSNNETIISNSRHFEALTKALNSILEVQKGIQDGLSADLFAIDIRECLRHLGTITGEYDVDEDILGNIFSNFCIGK